MFPRSGNKPHKFLAFGLHCEYGDPLICRGSEKTNDLIPESAFGKGENKWRDEAKHVRHKWAHQMTVTAVKRCICCLKTVMSPCVAHCAHRHRYAHGWRWYMEPINRLMEADGTPWIKHMTALLRARQGMGAQCFVCVWGCVSLSGCICMGWESHCKWAPFE